MGKTFGDYGSISGISFFRYNTAANGIFKSEFTYFSIGSDYSDFNTDLEEEADVNEEGNEDCSAIL